MLIGRFVDLLSLGKIAGRSCAGPLAVFIVGRLISELKVRCRIVRQRFGVLVQLIIFAGIAPFVPASVSPIKCRYNAAAFIISHLHGRYVVN